MADLYGTMTDKKFDAYAVKSIVDWWNSKDSLVAQFGSISSDDVYNTWKCKAIENFKGLYGVSKEGDGLYFEVTFHAKKNCFYVDVYVKQTQIIIEND